MNVTNLQNPDPRRKWYVMASVAMGMFLATIDGSIVNIALPVLERDLQTNFATVQWVLLGYMLTISTLMLSIGRLSDMFGKKPLYLSGFIVFTLGSALCGMAGSISQLIFFRIFQAVGAVMMTALGTAIITEAFPPAERGKALGIGGSMVSIGLISGPTIGGLILGSLSWHWIFFVNLPIGILGSLMVLRFVPHHRPPGGETFDFLGAFFMFVSMLAFLCGLTMGQINGFITPLTLGLLATSLLFLVLFLRVERSAIHPMIDLSMFTNRLFSINLVTSFTTFIATAGCILLMPFYLQNVLQYDPRTAGLLLAVFPLGMGVSAPVAGWLSDRFGSRRLTVAGLIVLLLGYVAVMTLNESTSALQYVLFFLPVGVGMGLFQSPNNSTIMGTAPRNRLGIASGLLALTRILGQTLGMSVLGAVWAARVSALGGLSSGKDATLALIPIQVTALQQTIAVNVVLIGGALVLSLWALRVERTKLSAQAEPQPVVDLPEIQKNTD